MVDLTTFGREPGVFWLKYWFFRGSADVLGLSTGCVASSIYRQGTRETVFRAHASRKTDGIFYQQLLIPGVVAER
jgi:hypothetical protein